MDTSLIEVDARGADRESLVGFLTGDEFPFHGVAHPSRGRVSADIDAGRYGDADHRAFWAELTGRGRVGLVVLSDLTDDAPLIDVRLGTEFRGRGFGRAVLSALTDLVFQTIPAVTRVEGNTRADNVAMRRVFAACGYAKEAHYRDGWPTGGGSRVDSVAYAILRRDWESGSVTPVDWDDLPDRSASD